MKKFLMLCTGMLTLALLLGEAFDPDFSLIGMASNAAGYVFLRAAIVVVLMVLLFTEVGGLPSLKHIFLAAAGGLFILTAVLLFTDRLRPADGVVFTETAIVFSLEALEAPAVIYPAFGGRPVGKFGVGNDFVKIS